MIKRFSIIAIGLLGTWLINPISTEVAVAQLLERDPVVAARYQVGPDALVQPGVPKGKLEGPFLHRSNIITNTTRQYWIYVPAQYTGDQPANLLVFQDGARAINPSGVLRVPQVMENLIAKKQIPITIGIFITPGQRGNEFPETIGTDNPNNRADEYDVLDDRYTRMLIEEIMPEVAKKYKLTDDPAGRVIGGASSGAICAFTVAWHRPDVFRNVISMIGSFTNIRGGHVYPQLVMEAEKKPIRIFLQDGIFDNRRPQDLNNDWHIQNKKMIAAFEAKGYDMAYAIGEGPHADDHGGAMLPQMLRWIWRDAPGIVKPDVDLVAEARAIKPVNRDLFPGFDKNNSVDPSGTYTFAGGGRGGRGGRGGNASTLKLSAKDGKVTGTLQTPQRGQAQPVTVDIQNAKMIGNKILFSAELPQQNQTRSTTFQGIVQPTQIVGYMMLDVKDQADTVWRATKVVDRADFSGNWKLQIAGPDGNNFESSLKLEPDGNSYKGSYASQLFGEFPVKNVVVNDDSLTFDVEFDFNGTATTASYVLKKNGDAFEGMIKSNFGGQASELPFKANKGN